MDSVLHGLAASAAWSFAHWQQLALAGVVLLSLANKFLPGHPSLAGATRWVVDLFALMPMNGARSAALSWLAGRLGPNAAGVFVDWLSGWLNIPFSRSVASAPPPPEPLPPARGHVLFTTLVLLALAALLVGAALQNVALLASAVLVALLIIGIVSSARRGPIVVLALLAISQTACLSAERKEQIKKDVIACGIACGVQELGILYQQAQLVLADGSISDADAQQALDALTTTAPRELVRCVVTSILRDLFGDLPPAPPTATVTPGRALMQDSPKDRTLRRGSAWLARG